MTPEEQRVLDAAIAWVAEFGRIDADLVIEGAVEYTMEAEKTWDKERYRPDRTRELLTAVSTYLEWLHSQPHGENSDRHRFTGPPLPDIRSGSRRHLCHPRR